MFWSQHLGCCGQNTSRIQNKEVYATLYLQALAFAVLKLGDALERVACWVVRQEVTARVPATNQPR